MLFSKRLARSEKLTPSYGISTRLSVSILGIRVCVCVCVRARLRERERERERESKSSRLFRVLREQTKSELRIRGRPGKTDVRKKWFLSTFSNMSALFWPYHPLDIRLKKWENFLDLRSNSSIYTMVVWKALSNSQKEEHIWAFLL